MGEEQDAHGGELVERFAVTSTPTVVFLRGGDEVDRLSGGVSLAAIEAALAD